MDDSIQVSKHIFVDLKDYKLEARDRIKFNLAHEPTHEPCNSECSDCTARKYCRWAPWNIGKMKGRRDP